MRRKANHEGHEGFPDTSMWRFYNHAKDAVLSSD
jgi:hypothetical protein